MPIHTAEDLLVALRGCGLFTPEQLAALARDLKPLGDDPPVLLRRLVDREWLSVYQLRKVLNGRAAELFVGPYMVLDKVGEGGMGRVYRAREGRAGREVALKVIRAS